MMDFDIFQSNCPSYKCFKGKNKVESCSFGKSPIILLDLIVVDCAGIVPVEHLEGLLNLIISDLDIIIITIIITIIIISVMGSIPDQH